jgi:hypothetical protein
MSKENNEMMKNQAQYQRQARISKKRWIDTKLKRS